MAAKVHSPSGALEECVVTELERGLCVFFRSQRKERKEARELFTNTSSKSLGLLITKSLCPVLQTSTLSDSSPGRTVSTPSTSSSMALTSQEVLSRSESGNQDRPETLVWSQHMELDWREAQQVGYLLSVHHSYVYKSLYVLIKKECVTLILQVPSQSSSLTTLRQAPGPWP